MLYTTFANSRVLAGSESSCIILQALLRNEYHDKGYDEDYYKNCDKSYEHYGANLAAGFYNYFTPIKFS